MTQEEKELLLKDLCARSLYGVKIQHYENETFLVDAEVEYVHNDYVKIKSKDREVYIMGVKPYLRPMSSMTEEERNELSHYYNDMQRIDFLYLHHIDCRFMIEKGLALEAPEDMYK